MPAIWPAERNAEVANVNATTGGATTFYSRVVSLVNGFFGDNNPFGTAATRDAGTGEGDLPVLNVVGELETGRIPSATTTEPGAVMLGAGIYDQEAGRVATPPMLRGALSGITQGLVSDNMEIERTLVFRVPYTTPAAGILVMSGGGQGGLATAGTSGSVAGTPTRGQDTVVQYGASSATAFSASSPTLVATGGGAQTVQGRAVSYPSFELLSIDAAATAAGRAPKFAFRRLAAGAVGGRGGFRSSLANDRRFAPDGQAGSLVVAFFNGGGIHLRMESGGNGGQGQAAPSGGADGEAGANGFAFFIRVE